MRHVVAPEVQLAADPLLAEQAGEPLGAVQRAGRVLPHALAADEQDAQPRAQPVEVVAARVGERVERVVEVGGLAALAPAVPARRVVVAREAERERERVRAPQREVDRVEGAEADAERGDLLRPAAVRVDPRHDLVEDPRLVALVRAGALLERQRAVRPRGAVEGVDAVELRPAAVDQLRRARRPRRGPRTPRRCRARPGRPGTAGPSARRRRRCPARRSPASTARRGGRHHHSSSSRSVRCGCSASRQAV